MMLLSLSLSLLVVFLLLTASLRQYVLKRSIIDVSNAQFSCHPGATRWCSHHQLSTDIGCGAES